MSARRQFSDKYSLPSNPKFIEFDKTDGSSDLWPRNNTKVVDDEGCVNFMRAVDLDEPLCIKWRVEVGNALSAALEYPPGPTYVLKDFPAGYRMFDHHKGKEQAPRHDAYLFGAPKIRFRSIPEFVPHAIWLMGDQSDVCKCKYCSKKPQREITESMGSILRSTQSPGPSRGPKPMKPKRQDLLAKSREQRLRDHKVYAAVQKTVKPLQPSRHVQTKHPMLVERNQDLRAVHSSTQMKLKRWFREGELVWCALDVPILGPEGDSAAIRFWPGLIDEIKLKTEPVPSQGNNTDSPDSASDVLDNDVHVSTPWTVRQSTAYKIRLLAGSYTYAIPDQLVLPYQAYAPPSVLIESLKRYRPTSKDFERETISKFIPWREMGSPPPPFAAAVAPFAVALQIGSILSGFWSMTDDWDFKYTLPPAIPRPPPSTSLQSAVMADSFSNAPLHDSGSISSGPSFSQHRNVSGFRAMPPDELQQVATRALGPLPAPMQSFSQTRFQGLWWGAERIWTEDFVRLKVSRRCLAPDGAENIFPPSGPGKAVRKYWSDAGKDPTVRGGAGMRGVFMRLDGLYTVDASQPDGGTRKEARICGMLYELADLDWEDPEEEKIQLMSQDGTASSSNPQPSSTQNGHLSNAPLSQPSPSSHYLLPSAPAGYKFRQILTPGYEAVLSLTLVSGRYYPGILSHPLLDEIVSEAFANPLGEGGLLGSSHLWALEGLGAGYANSVDPIRYKTSRIKMVEDADKDARAQLDEYVLQMENESQQEAPEAESMDVDDPTG